VIIYTTGTLCNRCNLLKAAFQKANIAYEEKPLDATIMARCLCETDEWVQAAPLVLDGCVWHFASDLFDASGDLKANWPIELKGIRPHKEFAGHALNEAKVQECSKIWGKL